MLTRRRVHRKAMHPHPPQWLLRHRRAVPRGLRLDRQAGEAAAQSVGLPRPELAAWWRWMARRRGERAIRRIAPAETRATDDE